MNNCEWLLNMTYEQRGEWLEAEHVEPNDAIGTESDVGPEMADANDSREKLEADVHNHIAISITPNKENDGVLAPYATVLEWLDRQVAITKNECREEHRKRLGELHGLLDEAAREREELAWRVEYNGELVEKVKRERNELQYENDALKERISQFAAYETTETAETCAAKCDIRDFDDSREKLEADIGLFIARYMPKEDSPKMFEAVCSFLDRQAAITAIEVARERYDIERDLITARDELQNEKIVLHARVKSLRSKLSSLQAALDQQRAATANANDLWGRTRDELAAVKAERDNLADDLLASNREREHLRRTLGIALDHAHDMLALVNLDGEVVS